MKRSLVVALAAVLAGLGTMAQPFAASAQEGAGMRGPGGPGRQGPPTLAVTGRGQVSASPDVAVVSVGALQQAKDAQAAQDAVNRIVQGALERIKAVGIEEAHIQTAGVSLYPVYSEHRPRPMMQDGEPEEPRITGYRASNTLQIQVHDLSKVGDVIDAAIEAGANQLHGLSYELREDGEAKRAALRQAVEKARSEAEAVADALGLQLRGVERVEVGDIGFRPPVPMMGRAMAMEAAMVSTPTEPGQVRVDATVTVMYRLAGPRGERGQAAEGEGGNPGGGAGE